MIAEEPTPGVTLDRLQILEAAERAYILSAGWRHEQGREWRAPPGTPGDPTTFDVIEAVKIQRYLDSRGCR